MRRCIPQGSGGDSKVRQRHYLVSQLLIRKRPPNKYFSGTLLDNQGRVALPRARIIALEVLRTLQNEDGSLPPLKDVTLLDLANKMSDSKDTKLRKDR
jgi:hypothetical protein